MMESENEDEEGWRNIGGKISGIIILCGVLNMWWSGRARAMLVLCDSVWSE